MTISWSTTFPIASASSNAEPLALIGSSAVEAKDVFKRVAHECKFSASALAKNNFRSERFFNLHVSIERMGKLPPQHPLHIRPEVQGSAMGILGVLKENFSVEPPTLSPTEDSGIALKWGTDDRERILMVDGEEIDFIERAVGATHYAVHVAAETADDELKLIFEHFGNPILSSV
jgi:hypothetical protein